MGSAASLLIYFITSRINHAKIQSKNIEIKNKIVASHIKTAAEAQRVGINKPIDLCYAMTVTTFMRGYSYNTGALTQETGWLRDKKSFEAAVGLFREMFGRDPLFVETEDWLTIMMAEAHMDQPGILRSLNIVTLLTLVSQELRKNMPCDKELFKLIADSKEKQYPLKHCYCRDCK